MMLYPDGLRSTFVSTAGAVTDATLRTQAVPALDRIVLAAVRTWRYRPLFVAGQPHPFCHEIAIQYDRAW